MDKQKVKKRKINYTLLIRTIIITILGVMPIFITSHAIENGLTETYHVYIDDAHIGEVDDRSVVQKIINEKVLEKLNTYDDTKIVLGQTVSMIPEKTFNQKHNNEIVREYLEEKLTINALASAINIDDQTVGYFNNKEDAEAVLRAYKLKYVNEEDLARIESADEVETEDNIQQGKLAVDEKTLSDIKFSKDISISETEVSPAEILTIEQGVKLLEKGTLVEEVHSVREGEVLGTIANKYDLTIEKLLELNPSLDEESLLQINQEINVTEFKPFVNVLVYEDELVEETINYETKIIESKDMYKGEERVKQKGQNGKKEVHYRIEKRNGKVIEKLAVDEKIIENPTEKIIIRGTKVISSRGSGDLRWPADGGYISSHLGMRWGRMHKGIDIARPTTRAIFAADNGVVESAGWDGSYGNKIVINHNNGMRTLYAHLSSIGVKRGQVVEKGTKIGVMGTTGNSTGVHLHFEVHLNGKIQNPMKYY